MRRWIVAFLSVLVTTACASSPGRPEGLTLAGGTGYYDLAYTQQLGLNLFVPSSDRKRHPVVVYIHGGAWKFSAKDDPGDKVAGLPILDVFRQLMARGYAVASLNHRTSDQATFPAQIHDVKAAVRWLRANAELYALDTNRFAAWGASSGGHLASMLATTGGMAEFEGTEGNPGQSSRVQAGIDWFAPIVLERQQPGAFEAELVGGHVPDKLRRASPHTYASAGDPPMLIAHGTGDRLVSDAHSRLFADALRGAGVPVELKFYAGADHGFEGYPRPQEIVDDLLTFLDTRLAVQN